MATTEAEAGPEPTGMWPCPCCDHETLGERGGWEICPVCFWEDDGSDHPDLDRPSGCNHGLTLREGRSNFRRLGACEPTMVRYVCSPAVRASFGHRPRNW